jgi:large subunit ribosomal protein L29
MKITEVRELTTKAIQERFEAEVSRLDQMLMQHSISPLDNPSQIKFLRRDIARFKTVIRERELNQNN